MHDVCKLVVRALSSQHFRPDCHGEDGLNFLRDDYGHTQMRYVSEGGQIGPLRLFLAELVRSAGQRIDK